jgi:hypothetical protein
MRSRALSGYVPIPTRKKSSPPSPRSAAPAISATSSSPPPARARRWSRRWTTRASAPSGGRRVCSSLSSLGAHRREILEQSLATFRTAVQGGHFGELLVGSERPVRGTHVFASIQALHAGRLEPLEPGAYDVVTPVSFTTPKRPPTGASSGSRPAVANLQVSGYRTSFDRKGKRSGCSMISSVRSTSRSGQ